MRSDFAGYKYMRTQLHDILPWEVQFFKELTDVQKIEIGDLLDAYTEKIESSGLRAMNLTWLGNHLRGIRLEQTGSRLTLNDEISYQNYSQSLRWVSKIGRIHHFPLNTRSVAKWDWHKMSVIVSTTSLEIISIGLMILLSLSKQNYHFLLLARAGAVLILLNCFFMLLPMIDASRLVPDSVLVHVFPAEYSAYYHKVFGGKIIFGSVVHTIAHICQIDFAMNHCREGCTRESIHIVPSGSVAPTVISYRYFHSLIPYWTGWVLVGIFMVLIVGMFLSKKRLIRFSINQIIHKYCAICGFIFIIVHGCIHLIGFNLSYIFLAPMLVGYLWMRRHELKPCRVHVQRWTITEKIIRLYLRDDKRLNSMLDGFGIVTVYVNCPRIHKLEWHPFTFSRGYQSSDGVLTIQRVGDWTNQLGGIIDSVDTLNIGYYKRSKFRFYRYYQHRLFFCAGVGISAFIACMADALNNPILGDIHTTLYWSVNDIQLVIQYGDQLNRLQQQLAGIAINIYYSNHTTLAVSHRIDARFEYLQSLMYGYYGIDIVSGESGPVPCRLGRINFIETISDYVLSTRKNIGVFICGSNQYADRVKDAVAIVQKKYFGMSIRVWSESV